jgi:hypothetical protein
MFPFSSRLFPFYFSLVFPFLSRFRGVSQGLVFKVHDKASLLVPMSMTHREGVWFRHIGRYVQYLANLLGGWFEGGKGKDEG